jgi:hypothetical protein
VRHSWPTPAWVSSPGLWPPATRSPKSSGMSASCTQLEPAPRAGIQRRLRGHSTGRRAGRLRLVRPPPSGRADPVRRRELHLHRPGRPGARLQALERYHLDIVCLQEIKVAEPDFPYRALSVHRYVCLVHGRPDRGPAVGTGAVRWSNRCPAALAGTALAPPAH